MLLLYFLVYVTACVMAGIFAMFLSVIFHHAVAVIGVHFGLLLGNLFFEIPSSLRVAAQIYGLTPLKVLNNSFQQDLRLVKIFGNFLTAEQIAPILFLGLSVFMSVVGGISYRKRSIA